MAIDLYEATAANFIQTLTAVQRVLAKGRAHAEAQGADINSYCALKLADDMFPLNAQVQILVNNSIGALEDAERGFYAVKRSNLDYAGCEHVVAETLSDLQSFTRERVNALEGKAVAFEPGGGIKFDFTAEAFLISFSLPNFYFHVTTAYDILRFHGVPLGKVDYLGPMRTRLG